MSRNSVETSNNHLPNKQEQIQETGKQTVRDLEDLAREVQLNRLEHSEEAALQAINDLPNTLKPNTATPEQLSALDTFHMGALFLIREVLLKQPNIDAGTLSTFFTADTTGFTKADLVVWNKLRSIAGNKNTYPDLYENLFGHWSQGIATMQSKLQAEQKTTAHTEKSQERPVEGNLFDKLLELAKKNPLLATVGTVGVGIALYHMWKNGGWQRSVVIGLFALAGIGAMTSETAKETFKKLGVDVEREEQKDGRSQDTFGGEETLNTPAQNSESDIEKYEMQPLKVAMGTFQKSITNKLLDLGNFLQKNPTIKWGGGALIAQSPLVHSLLQTGGALTFNTVTGLAGLSFSTITHHPIASSMAVLSFMGGKGALSEKAKDMGDVLVPGTPEGMKAYIKDKLPELEKYCDERGIPAVKEKDIQGIVDILYGKVPMETLIPKADEAGKIIVDTLKDTIGETPEKMVHNTNLAAFKSFNSDIQMALRNTEQKDEYTEIAALIQPILKDLQEGKPLHEKHIATLLHAPALGLAGFQVSREGGIITLYKRDMRGVIEKNYPKKLGIDPTLSPDEQFRKAQQFTYETSYLQTLDRGFHGGRVLLDRFLAITGQKTNAETPEEFLLGGLKKGMQLAIYGTEVALIGAKNKYILGPYNILRGTIAKLRGNDIQAVEAVADMQYGMMPIVFLGVASSLVRLRSPFSEGKLSFIMKTVAYPLDLAISGGKIVFKHVIPHMWNGEYSKILKNPKMIATHSLQQTMRMWQGNVYTVRGIATKEVKILETMARDLSGIHESLRLLYKAENKIYPRANLRSAVELLQNNQLSGKHFINEANLSSKIAELEGILKNGEAAYKEAKINYKRLVGVLPIQPLHKVNTKQPLKGSEVKKQYNSLLEGLSVEKAHDPIYLQEVAKKRALSSPKEAMKELHSLEELVKNSPEKIKEVSALFKGYEEGINEVVQRTIDRSKKGIAELTEDQVLALLKHLDTTYNEPFSRIKKSLNTSMIEIFNAMPTKSKGMANAINDAFRPRSNSLLTHISQVTPKGRATMFTLQAGALVAGAKALEHFTTPPEERDLLKTIGSIASPDTVQLLVDIAPYSGTISNATSVVTGRKSLEPLANMAGFEFEDGSASRLENLGWFFVSAAGDAATLIPVVGWGAKASLISAKLTALVSKGGKLGKAAESLLKVWPKIEKFASVHGWDKAMQTVVKGLQNNRTALRNINIYGGVGATAVTLGIAGYNLIYDKPVELQLIPDSEIAKLR